MEIASEHVGLRSLRADDVGERYLGWLQDPEVNAYLEVRHTPQTLESLASFVAELSDRPDTLLLAIVEIASEEHIGNIKVGPLDPHHRTADLGLLIGERRCWGRGYGTEAIRLAAQLGFERLGARKLTASCYSGNRGSAAAFRRAGWVEEGRRPQQFLDDAGHAHDQVLFGLLRP